MANDLDFLHRNLFGGMACAYACDCLRSGKRAQDIFQRQGKGEESMKHCVYINDKAREALDRIMAFNPTEVQRDVLSSLILEKVKEYKGKKPPKIGK